MNNAKCPVIFKLSPIAQAVSVALLAIGSYAHSAPPVQNYNTQSNITTFENEDCVRARAGLNSLTCTANDISLANITLASGEASTCYAGETITRKLQFYVTSTAQNRYNWAFYTGMNGDINPLEGGLDNCRVWVGENSSGTPLNAQSLNGDLCTDVTKNLPIAYTGALAQELTLACKDIDGDFQVDLEYCSTWNQNDDSVCNTNGEILSELLPVPGAPSKCNCGTVTVPITVLPSEPTLKKTIVGANSRTEQEVYGGSNTFVFDLAIKNPNAASSITITEITDTFNGTVYSIPSAIPNPFPSMLNEGDIYLKSATDTDGTCLASGSETIAPGATYTCRVTIVWNEWTLVDTDTGDMIVRQDAINKFAAKWKFGTQTPESVGPSNEVTVSITDVPPVLSIGKTASKTSIPETGTAGFDLINYTVTFGNDSGWDTISIASSNLTDTLQQNMVTPTTNGLLTSCTISNLITGAANKQQCLYSVNLASVFTINQGDVIKNTVLGTPTDEEGTNGTQKQASATVTVENVNPMVTLKKYVKAGVSASTDATEYMDAQSSQEADSPSVEEWQLTPGDSPSLATYLFVVSNNSFEPFTITNFIDFAEGDFAGTPTQQFDSEIVEATATTCDTLVGKTIAVGASEKCLTTFKIAGNAGDVVVNTAWVKVSDGEGGSDYDTDPAHVRVVDAQPTAVIGLDLALHVTVEVRAGTSNREPILYNPATDILYDGVELYSGTVPDVFAFDVDWNDCGTDEVSLLPDEDTSCTFIITRDSATPVQTVLDGLKNLKVQAKDDEANPYALEVVVTVKSEAP